MLKLACTNACAIAYRPRALQSSIHMPLHTGVLKQLELTQIRIALQEEDEVFALEFRGMIPSAASLLSHRR